ISDLSSVHIEDWRTGRFVQVPSVDPNYTNGLSLAEHMILSGNVKSRLKAYERVTVGRLVEAREDLRAKIQVLKRSKKLSNKRLVAAIGEDDWDPAPTEREPQS